MLEAAGIGFFAKTYMMLHCDGDFVTLVRNKLPLSVCIVDADLFANTRQLLAKWS